MLDKPSSLFSAQCTHAHTQSQQSGSNTISTVVNRTCTRTHRLYSQSQWSLQHCFLLPAHSHTHWAVFLTPSGIIVAVSSQTSKTTHTITTTHTPICTHIHRERWPTSNIYGPTLTLYMHARTYMCYGAQVTLRVQLSTTTPPVEVRVTSHGPRRVFLNRVNDYILYTLSQSKQAHSRHQQTITGSTLNSLSSLKQLAPLTKTVKTIKHLT